MPSTPADRPQLDPAAVTAALDRVLAQPEFVRSPQLARFLSYIVDRTLAGETQAIKAYAIAVDVFGRPSDFDPQKDPIVRVQARRLRTLLHDYYAGAGAGEEIRILLPVGRYVPEFLPTVREAEPGEFMITEQKNTQRTKRHLAASRTTKRLRVAGVALLAFVLGGATIYAVWNWARSGADPFSAPLTIPRVAVADFQTLSEVEEVVPRVAGLALELVTDLEQFGSLHASYFAPGANRQRHGGLDYALTGVVRLEGDVVEFSAILTEPQTASVVWNHTLSVPTVRATETGLLDEVSRSFSLILGSARGPLHGEASGLLTSGDDLSGQETPYLCRLAFDLYRASGSDADGRRAMRCLEALTPEAQSGAAVLAAMASLIVELGETSEQARHVRLARAAERLQQALSLDPTSAFVWEQQARWHQAQGEMAAARAAYGVSIQLNPARSDALAGLAQLLAFAGNYSEARNLAEASMNTPDPPAWYYGVAALLALREGDNQHALAAAERYESADHELGPILALVAAQRDANASMVSRYLPQILEVPAFREAGILPRLRRRISDNELMDEIRTNLVRAGVPVQALISSF